MLKKPLRRVRFLLERVSIWLSVSFGVLAIANVQTVWSAKSPASLANAVSAKQAARKAFRQKLSASNSTDVELSPREKLMAALADDEISEQNPFAGLSNMQPLQHLLSRGVKAFERQVFRSPEYKEESGYDLISYDIEHESGAHSTILAYSERPLVESSDLITRSNKSVTVVILLEADQVVSHQTVYRSGQWIASSDLPVAAAQALVSHKLNSGIPFFSVAR